MELPDIDAAPTAQPNGFIEAPWFEPSEFDMNMELLVDNVNDAALPVQPNDFIDAPWPDPPVWDMMTDPVLDGVSYAESPGPSGLGMNTIPALYGVTGDNGLPLNHGNIGAIDADETRLQTSTVEAHVGDTYNTGDHIHAPGNRIHTPGDRRRRLRIRKPRCEDAYPCDEPGCGRVFDRQCDLT